MTEPVIQPAEPGPLARFGFVPDPVLAIIVVVLVILAVLIVERVAFSALHRLVADRSAFLTALLAKAKWPVRVASQILGVTLVLPYLPLEPFIYDVTARWLQVAFIVLVGWLTITATHLSAEFYLDRLGDKSLASVAERKQRTQIGILTHAADTVIVLLTAAAALMSFDTVRQYGISLFASAGAAGLVVGFAARPVLMNLIAGVQIAMTQPIRIEDVVIVEGEWGRVEEITATYVVIRIWDLRRLIVPLAHFIERPFENWTRESDELIGVVTVQTDYSVPVETVRQKLFEIVKASEHWDGKSAGLVVTDAGPQTMTLRATMSANNSSHTWSLRCEVREKLIAFLQQHYPEALPRMRASLQNDNRSSPIRLNVADAS